MITLIISDVPGNDPSVVASGPTITDAAVARENDVRILATSDDAIQAAALRALELDVTPYLLGDLAGDARELASEHAKLWSLSIQDIKRMRSEFLEIYREFF